MLDTIIKGEGNSRNLKSSIPDGTTWTQALAMLRAGTFPVDLFGINEAGMNVVGTPYNKNSVLTDVTCTTVGIPSTSVPNDAFQKLGERAASLESGKVDKTEKTDFGVVSNVAKTNWYRLPDGLKKQFVLSDGISLDTKYYPAPDGSVYFELADQNLIMYSQSGSEIARIDIGVPTEPGTSDDTYNIRVSLIDPENKAVFVVSSGMYGEDEKGAYGLYTYDSISLKERISISTNASRAGLRDEPIISNGDSYYAAPTYSPYTSTLYVISKTSFSATSVNSSDWAVFSRPFFEKSGYLYVELAALPGKVSRITVSSKSTTNITLPQTLSSIQAFPVGSYFVVFGKNTSGNWIMYKYSLTGTSSLASATLDGKPKSYGYVDSRRFLMGSKVYNISNLTVYKDLGEYCSQSSSITALSSGINSTGIMPYSVTGITTDSPVIVGASTGASDLQRVAGRIELGVPIDRVIEVDSIT